MRSFLSTAIDCKESQGTSDTAQSSAKPPTAGGAVGILPVPAPRAIDQLIANATRESTGESSDGEMMSMAERIAKKVDIFDKR